MTDSVGTGFRGEGWLEEADSCRGERPQRTEIIMMEDELGIRNIASIEIVDNDKAWTYYYDMKARLEQQQRKTA